MQMMQPDQREHVSGMFTDHVSIFGEALNRERTHQQLGHKERANYTSVMSSTSVLLTGHFIGKTFTHVQLIAWKQRHGHQTSERCVGNSCSFWRPMSIWTWYIVLLPHDVQICINLHKRSDAPINADSEWILCPFLSTSFRIFEENLNTLLYKPYEERSFSFVFGFISENRTQSWTLIFSRVLIKSL